MSIWSAQFVEKCFLWRCTGVNDRGDTEYTPSLNKPGEPITARFEHTRKEVLDKAGNRVLSDAELYTDTKLHPLDKVQCHGRVWTVKNVSPIYDLAGRLDHYEAVL